MIFVNQYFKITEKNISHIFHVLWRNNFQVEYIVHRFYILPFCFIFVLNICMPATFFTISTISIAMILVISCTFGFNESSSQSRKFCKNTSRSRMYKMLKIVLIIFKGRNRSSVVFTNI